MYFVYLMQWAIGVSKKYQNNNRMMRIVYFVIKLFVYKVTRENFLLRNLTPYILHTTLAMVFVDVVHNILLTKQHLTYKTTLSRSPNSKTTETTTLVAEKTRQRRRTVTSGC
jgi:hypothetical protein